jgi:hypothetical protein
MCVAPLVVLDVLSHTPHIDLYASPKSACASADGAVADSRDVPKDPTGPTPLGERPDSGRHCGGTAAKHSHWRMATTLCAIRQPQTVGACRRS